MRAPRKNQGSMARERVDFVKITWKTRERIEKRP
jgi:hypothetical protein